MDNRLIVVPKPDNISWEDITGLLHLAFAKRVDQGLKFRAASQDVQTTMKKVGNGVCLVALLDNRLVGTITVNFEKVSPKTRRWYHENNYCYRDQLAVHPSYQKSGIANKLKNEALKICFEKGVDACIVDTSIKAGSLVKSHLDSGFQRVELLSSIYTNYYSVRFRLPVNGKRFNRYYVLLRYCISYIKCKLLKRRNGRDTPAGVLAKKIVAFIKR